MMVLENINFSKFMSYLYACLLSVACMCSALRSQKVSDPLQVEYSKLVVNSHMISGNKTQVICKSHLSSPQICSVLYFEIGSFF